MLNIVNRVSFLSLMNPHVMLVEYKMYLRLFIFNTLKKSRMGTRLPEIGADRLVINQSVVPMEWSLPLKTGVVFPCLLSKVISFIISTLYIKHYHLILSLFVAICEIWLPWLTYGVYLVLFLKPGVTKWYQSNADCRTQA
jgi:hypothetical protein